jgi:hypothetical protein
VCCVLFVCVSVARPPSLENRDAVDSSLFIIAVLWMHAEEWKYGVFLLFSVSRLCDLGKCGVGKPEVLSIWDCSTGRTVRSLQ